MRRLGTIATSSREYARRADFPIPISTSATGQLYRRPTVELEEEDEDEDDDQEGTEAYIHASFVPHSARRDTVSMKLGIFSLNMGPATAEHVATIARAAEDAGMESVWAGEHVVLPDPRVPPSPMDPKEPALDPLFALAWAGAVTTTLRLATGIVILPQRNPVVLAKEVASLDVLTSGRVTLGIGVGYLEPEFRAIGANFPDRGAVTDEHLAAMRALWYDDAPAYHGRFVDFGGIDAHPRPVQPRIPVVVGGYTPPAYRRAVTTGEGWYGFLRTPEALTKDLEGIRVALDQHERPAELGELEITVTPWGMLTPELVDAYAELGVHRLVVLPGGDMRANSSTDTTLWLKTIEESVSVVSQ